MFDLLTAVASAAVAGITVYALVSRSFRARNVALDKMREEAQCARSNAETALQASRDEMARMRTASAEDLKRQADQFRDEIRALNEKLTAAENRAKEERDIRDEVKQRLVAAEEELKASAKLQAEKEEQYKRTLEQGTERFRALAQQVLEDREKKLKEEGTNPLNSLVTQLKQEIDNLKRSISTANEKSAANHTDLMGRITSLVDQTNKVTEQANNLAGAIRGDARLTGEWAEIQLRRILDMSGMTETMDYTYQESFADVDTGRKTKRTDFVIKMPNGRALIIDSKNTIAAAERYHGADDDQARSDAAAEIVASVRAHVDEIKSARYQESVPGALETVLMYIPLEEVYLLAMKATVSVGGEREHLRDYARRNNVVFVNSASVVPVVKLVEMMWNVERAEKNRQETIAAAEELLKRSNDFIAEFVSVGDAFNAALEKYETAKTKLIDAPNGRSITKAVARLVDLGVQHKTRGGKTYSLAEPVESACHH